MKKLIAVLICMVLCAVCGCAMAEPESLSVEEMTDYIDLLLADALRLEPYAKESTANGWKYSYDGFALYSPEDQLNEESFISAVELNGNGAYVVDMRGVAVGDTLNSLIDSYPLQDEALSGTWSEAVMYIDGMLPDSVSMGHAVRNGSRVSVVEYTVYAVDGEIVERNSVIYTLQGNAVSCITIQLAQAMLTHEAAQEELEQYSYVQESSEYVMYKSTEPEIMAREDLLMEEIDFLSATPAMFTAKFGEPESDSYEPDGDGYLRVMQWNGLTAVFECDANYFAKRCSLVRMYRDMMEGPRGVRVDDTLENVLERFPMEDEENLYGDGISAPYGVRENNGVEVAVSYAVDAEGEALLVRMIFVGNKLAEMTITCL